MDSQTNQTITWTALELTGLLEEEDAHVHFERTTKHLALHPYHLINIQRGLNQILKSSLNSYDKELNGFVLALKNPKLLSNSGELLYDSPFIHIDIEADFYLFRPTVGSFLKGIVNKKGLDHIVVLVHRVYTISIPKPEDMEEWLGDSVEIGQEIRCCINQVDSKSKPPFICATLNSDYLQGCRLSESINNMEDVIESHNLSSIIKVEKTNSEISEEDNISDKERKKHRKKHKKSREIDTFKNIKYEDSNTDSTIERHNVKNTIKIDNSINEEDDTISDKEKKKHQKKHKKSREIDTFKNIKYEDSKTDTTIDRHNVNSTVKIDNSISEEDDTISDKEKKKQQKKHKKSREINTFKNIKYEDSNTDSTIDRHNVNSTVKIDNSINEEDYTISDKEKKRHQKKHKKSLEIASESFFKDQTKAELSNNTENVVDRDIKCEINDNTDSIIRSQNLNSTIKIDTSTNEILENDAISEKEKRKYRKKHKKSRESDLESIPEDKNQIKLDNNIHINIKYEDNINNINSSIESHNLDSSIIKIDSSINGILEDNAFSDKEKKKFRKKHKKSREIGPESISEDKNETKSDNNTGSNIYRNIKCEDNLHNTNSAIKNHNLDRDIKIENLSSGISEDTTSDRERTKHRKKRKKSRETDTENEAASDYLEDCKKRRKTSIISDLESKTHIKVKAEKFDSDVEFKSPVKIKVEKV